MIRLAHLRVFIAVAENGTLAEAAQRLGRTPSAVSMTLKQIEETLEGPLFEGERKTRLTPLGHYTLERARRAVQEHESALTDIRRFARGEEGVARIASVPSVATRLVPRAVMQLRRSRPGLRVELREADSHLVAEAVARGTVDFGVASRSEASADLKEKLLIEDPFMLVARRDHPLASLSRRVEWNDLDAATFIANGLCGRINAPEVGELVGGAPLIVHNVASLFAFVAEGFGVTLLPHLSAPRDERLCALPLADTKAIRRLYLFNRSGETLSPPSAALAEALWPSARAINREIASR